MKYSTSTCPDCGHENLYRGAPPDGCVKCLAALDTVKNRGFTVSRRPGEELYLEDIDEDGNIIRTKITVLSSSANSVRLAVDAPEENVIRRGEIPFKGQCEWCAGIIRPGRDGQFCSDDCAAEFALGATEAS